LTGSASALNVVFIVGFPLAFVGHVEGGIPEFLYGVPTIAACLFPIPFITALLAVASSVAAVANWRNTRIPTAARIEHSVMAMSLLNFAVFAWYWCFLPTVDNLKLLG
jgi:hypothetical protein